jgi:glucose/arabinose dehydrogenase
MLLSGFATRAQGFSTERITSGLSRPVFLTAPPGDLDRVFVIEQHTGRIQIIRLRENTVDRVPFLTVPNLSTGPEQGLLGLAFHPDYASNGFFYVYKTVPDSRVVRYTVSADPDLADAASATSILEIAQPQSNHNAGWIGFGADGYLYIATGDGGSGDDSGTGHTPTTGNAQDLTDNLLGKILRIDVDGDDFPAEALRNYAVPASNPFVGVSGDDEIWVYGLRNPYRSSFDRLTGDLYIADVGQAHCEEINVQLGASGGGENYGWRLREGVIATPTSGIGGPHPPAAIDPIFDYPHPSTASGEPCSGPGSSFTGVSVTGGYVYRGPIAELFGRYLFADFGTGRIWSLRFDGSDPSSFDGLNYDELTDHGADVRFIPDAGNIATISSFGEDAAGNFYILNLYEGAVFRVPEPSAGLLQLVALATMATVFALKARTNETVAGSMPASPDDHSAMRTGCRAGED